MIKSKENPKIKYVRKLVQKAKFRYEEGAFLLEGPKVVLEAMKKNRIRQIFLSESMFETKESNAVIAQATSRDISYEIVSDAVFREMSDTVTPQGVMAVVNMPEYDIEKALSGKRASALILENVRDPGNIGTMVRTAEGAGFDALILSEGCADVFAPKVVRSTMGSILRVPCVMYRGEISKVLTGLKGEGFRLYATVLGAEVDYRETKYDGRVGIIIGNEAKGITAETASLADERVMIPMQGQLESLNASVAAALLMYEVNRH